MGGIMNATDAIEFMIAGASAVQVGTALFIDPTIPIQIIDGLSQYMERHKIQSVNELNWKFTMLNYIKTHMYAFKTISYGLIFSLVFSQCTNSPKPVEVPKKVQEVDTNSLNYKISNELSEFSGSSFIAKKAGDFLQQWNLAGNDHGHC